MTHVIHVRGCHQWKSRYVTPRLGVEVFQKASVSQNTPLILCLSHHSSTSFVERSSSTSQTDSSLMATTQVKNFFHLPESDDPCAYPIVTQHYLWASGHFVLLVASLRYFLAWITFKAVSTWWYKGALWLLSPPGIDLTATTLHFTASFTGALISYAIVCQ